MDRWVQIPPLAFPKMGRQNIKGFPIDAEIVKLLDLRAKLYVDGYKVVVIYFNKRKSVLLTDYPAVEF